MIRVCSAPDPFILPYLGEWNRTDLKTPASSIINNGVRNIFLLVAGQSQICSVNPTSYVPTNIANIKNFNVLDGGFYQATGSLLGCTNYDAISNYGNISLRVADSLITGNVCDVVWLINVAIGGTSVV